MSAPGAENNRRHAWSLIVAVPLAAVLLWLSVRGVDWRGVWSAIAGARWGFLALGGALMAVALSLRALRWRILLSAGERFGFGTVFSAMMAGYLGNNFLPARAGELIRSLAISRRSSLTTAYVLTTALGERLMDAIALVLWSSLIVLASGSTPRWMADVSRAAAVVSVAGALVIALLPHMGGPVHKSIGLLPLPAKFRERLLHLADQVMLGVRAFHHPGRFFGFAGLTAAIWTTDAFTVVVLARSLGPQLTFGAAMLFVTALGLSSALPSTPGYVGIYQFVAVTVLVPFGVGRDTALAYSLVAQAMTYAVMLLLGLPSVYEVFTGKWAKGNTSGAGALAGV
ncbi:MAG TPA: lysylphosphatidylglycerol synthase transmembrane domain-containing protein [Bryobacteraceae bacterium]